MATYYARMLDASTGGEGSYTFEGPENLLKKTGDEIVAKFFENIENTLLKNQADWELNGVMKNKERGIVTAIGSLIPEKDDEPMPFLLMISSRKD